MTTTRPGPCTPTVSVSSMSPVRLGPVTTVHLLASAIRAALASKNPPMLKHRSCERARLEEEPIEQRLRIAIALPLRGPAEAGRHEDRAIVGSAFRRARSRRGPAEAGLHGHARNARGSQRALDPIEDRRSRAAHGV